MQIKKLFNASIILSCLLFGKCGGMLFAQNTRLWATYYGGANQERSCSIATDAAGNVYLAGISNSSTGIASGGFQNASGGGSDAFLVKFNAAGARLWATYYGGTGDEMQGSVATDAAGNVYLLGSTNSFTGIASGGFQNIHGGGFNDAYLVKFDAAGSRLWATYYGGAGNDYGENIRADITGNIYLAGTTGSPFFIASGGFQNIYNGGGGDAYLVKFDAAGNRLWGTYYGGMLGDAGHSVTVDDVTGNVYLAGTTSSSFVISSGGFQNNAGGLSDAFLVKFDAFGNRLWATYYGGAGGDLGCGVATDAMGNVYLGGMTMSAAGIASGGFLNVYSGSAVYHDSFLVKFNSAGNRLWGTYYASMVDDFGNVTTDALGNVYMATITYSNGFASGGFQNNLIMPVNELPLVVKFDPNGIRQCATYYSYDHQENCYIATDGLGTMYLTGSTGMPTGISSGGFQNTFGGGTDAYLVKFCSCGNVCNTLSAFATSTNIKCNNQCVGTATASFVNGTPPYSYLWNTGGQTTQIATGLCVGNYTVVITDASTATATATVTVTQPPSALSSSITLNNVSCNGQCNGNATVVPSGGTPGYTYSWNTAPVQISSNATSLCPGNYSCTITDANGCTNTQTVTITEPSAIILIANSTNNTNCSTPNGVTTVTANGGTPGYTYLWTPSPVQTTQTATGLSTGIYTAIVADANGCTKTQTVNVNGPVFPSATVSSTNVLCNGGNTGSATVNATGGTTPYTYSWNTVPVQNASNANGLSVGNYNVNVADANGCISTQTVTIAEPLALVIVASATETDCNANTGTATANVGGGTNTFTYSWNPTGQITPTATGLGVGNYLITVTDANGCTSMQIVTIDLNGNTGKLYLPNVFSPNNDGENDEFCLQGGIENCVKDIHISIYNRWGENVFKSIHSAFCWDGTYNGKTMNTGVFVYYLNATLVNEKNISKKGNVSLIR